jgi:hypothetical protein
VPEVVLAVKLAGVATGETLMYPGRVTELLPEAFVTVSEMV